VNENGANAPFEDSMMTSHFIARSSPNPDLSCSKNIVLSVRGEAHGIELEGPTPFVVRNNDGMLARDSFDWFDRDTACFEPRKFAITHKHDGNGPISVHLSIQAAMVGAATINATPIRRIKAQRSRNLFSGQVTLATMSGTWVRAYRSGLPNDLRAG
jgi:hypothetical protein